MRRTGGRRGIRESDGPGKRGKLTYDVLFADWLAHRTVRVDPAHPPRS